MSKGYKASYIKTVGELREIEESHSRLSWFQRNFGTRGRSSREQLHELRRKKDYLAKRFTQVELRTFFDEVNRR